MIAFACPGCGKTYCVPDEETGRKTTCRKCNQSFIVPPIPNKGLIAQPRQPHDVELPDEASPDAAALAPRQQKRRSILSLKVSGRVVGGILLMIGALVVLGGLSMDTTTYAPGLDIGGLSGRGQRVHNIGLIGEKLAIIIAGVGTSIVGAIFATSK